MSKPTREMNCKRGVINDNWICRWRQLVLPLPVAHRKATDRMVDRQTTVAYTACSSEPR